MEDTLDEWFAEQDAIEAKKEADRKARNLATFKAFGVPSWEHAQYNFRVSQYARAIGVKTE